MNQNVLENIGSYERGSDEGVGDGEPKHENTAPTSYDNRLQEALLRSKSENHMTPSASQTDEVLDDLCPVRHRQGIVALLQMIEGHEPRLDSAPKVYTLAVLAKYFDCTNKAVSFSSFHSACLRTNIIRLMPSRCGFPARRTANSSRYFQRRR
jgi:hypothetical protein